MRKMMTIRQAKSIESLWGKGYTSALIAKRLGLTQAAVNSYVYTHRDKCPRRRAVRKKCDQSVYQRGPRDVERHERMVELWKQGLTSHQIADELGLTKSVVENHIRYYRSKFPRRDKGAPRDALQHERMVELWGQGLTIRQIAAELCLTRSAVDGYIQKHRKDFPYRKRRRGTGDEQQVESQGS